MASPMPVLPEVPSMMVPPGLSAPLLSASSIMRTAMRSLLELPGLVVSIFDSTVPFTSLAIELILTSGVWPIASRMLLKIFLSLTKQEYRVREGFEATENTGQESTRRHGENGGERRAFG